MRGRLAAGDKVVVEEKALKAAIEAGSIAASIVKRWRSGDEYYKSSEGKAQHADAAKSSTKRKRDIEEFWVGHLSELDEMYKRKRAMAEKEFVKARAHY